MLYWAGMKVILLQHVKNVGVQGAVVNVSDGFALNCLLPQKKAVVASKKAISQIKQRETVELQRTDKKKEKLKKSIGKLDGYRLTLNQKTSEAGTLYAAVSTKTIADALARAGFDVAEGAIVLKDSIKEVGERQVPLKLPYGLSATIKLIIKSK